MRQVLESDVPSGKWAVLFKGITPVNFCKQIQVGPAKMYITQEPPSTCRFCNTPGHNIFDFTTKTDKELGEKAFVGTVGEISENILTLKYQHEKTTLYI